MASRKQSEMSEGQSTTWTERVEAVYREQARELWAMFYAHCGQPERAYDALQEAFLRLQQQSASEILDLRAWLLHVGRNWLRDQARRKSSGTVQSDLLETHGGNEAEPIESLMGEELRGQVREALLRLRDDDREVLVLRYALSWSSQRIAETVGSTPAAVDMRLSRARQRLATELEKMGVRHEPV